MPFMRDGKRDYKRDENGRECSVCGKYKPWGEFSSKGAKRYKRQLPKNSSDKQPKCKACAKIEVSSWRENQSSERLKDLYLKRRYGISYSQYCTMLEDQDFKCAICLIELDTELGKQPLNRNSAVVDHCHTTNEVRGILCNECNRGLGYFHDNSEVLMNAAKYLSGQDLSPEGGKCSCLI